MLPSLSSLNLNAQAHKPVDFWQVLSHALILTRYIKKSGSNWNEIWVMFLFAFTWCCQCVQECRWRGCWNPPSQWAFNLTLFPYHTTLYQNDSKKGDVKTVWRGWGKQGQRMYVRESGLEVYVIGKIPSLGNFYSIPPLLILHRITHIVEKSLGHLGNIMFSFQMICVADCSMNPYFMS